MPQHGLLMDVKIDIERILADDRRHHRVVGLDEVAGVDHAAAEPAGDPFGQLGSDARPVKIQLSQIDIGLGRTERRLGLGVVKSVAIKFLAADRPSLLEKDLGPAVFVIQPPGMCLRLLECALLAVQRGLERSRIDQEKEIVFLALPDRHGSKLA